MFCVSHVRISLHFIKNMSDLAGWKWRADWSYIQGTALVTGSCWSHSVLWSIVPTYGNIVVSWFLLSLSFYSRQCGLHLKSVYEAGWVSGDASLCLFTEPEDCLSSLLLLLDTLLKWLKTFPTMGIFFHENTGHLAGPLGRHWAFQNQHLISFHEVS